MDGALAQDLLAIVSVGGHICAGLIFCLAALQKMRHWSLLSGVISNYRLLPVFLIAPATIALPLVEVILGLVLLSGLFEPLAGLGAMALLMLFATAIGINLMRGRSDIDCGCGQPFLSQRLRWSLVVRNILLAGFLVPSLFIPAAMALANFLTGICAGFSFVMIYFLFNALAALPKPLARAPHRASTI